MKTLTEFPAITIKNATKTKADLIIQGKTPEELPQALGEALKLEGDKLNFMIQALESVGTRLDDLKRVVVFSAAEGETAPSSLAKHGDHYYSVEFYPAIPKKGHDGKHAPSDRKGGRGDKGGKGGRDRKGGGRDSGKSAGAKSDRPARPARAPRVETPIDPSKITGKIIPKSAPAAVHAAPAPEAASGGESSHS